jgi:hypothetical protein
LPDQDVSAGMLSSNRDEPCTSPASIASGWPGNPDRRESSPFAMPPSWRADIPTFYSTEDSSAAGREENTHRNDNTTLLPSFHRHQPGWLLYMPGIKRMKWNEKNDMVLRNLKEGHDWIYMTGDAGINLLR